MNETCTKCGKPWCDHREGECNDGSGNVWHPANRLTPPANINEGEKNLLCLDCAGEGWKEASGGTQGACQKCGKETYLRELIPTETKARKVAEEIWREWCATHFDDKEAFLRLATQALLQFAKDCGGKV